MVIRSKMFLTDKQTDRLWRVDFFKGIAIMMVIFVHSAQPFPLPDWFSSVSSLGQLGCQIFFVLSAFTLCLSLSKRKQKYGSFLLKRIERLAPGYWSMIIIYIILAIVSIALLGQRIMWTSLEPIDILINILFLNGLIPGTANNYVVLGGWFVGTVFLLYLITPMMFHLFNSSNKKWEKIRHWLFPLSVMAICLIIAGCINTFVTDEYRDFIYFNIITQAPIYALGFSLYSVYTNGDFVKIKYPFLKMLISFCLSLILFFVEIPFCMDFFPFFFGLGFVYAFVFAQKVDMPRIKLVRWVEKIGKISFSIYLTHTFIVFLGERLFLKVWDMLEINISSMLLYILALPFIYGLCFLLGQLFEVYIKQIEKIIKKFKNKKGVV